MRAVDPMKGHQTVLSANYVPDIQFIFAGEGTDVLMFQKCATLGIRTICKKYTMHVIWS